jgi:hypothetical protein
MREEKFVKISKEETLKAESKNIILKFWQDSVISQLIANGILVSLPLLAAVITEFLEANSIADFFSNFLQLNIKLYILILITLVIIICYFLYLKFVQNIRKFEKELSKETVGYYSFKNLNNVLLTSYIELPKHLQIQIGLKELDLLTAFRLFISQFNYGINWQHPTEDGDFMHYQLGPELMSYGLIEKVESIDNSIEGNINSYVYQTSENGYKFFALLESYGRLYNIETFEKEVAERKKLKDEVLKK